MGYLHLLWCYSKLQHYYTHTGFMMTDLKQNLLATALLLTALTMSLMIGYWLNFSPMPAAEAEISQQVAPLQKLNKLHHSFILLLPAIR